MTIEGAAERLKELPGDWWWRVGLRKVSADATIEALTGAIEAKAAVAAWGKDIWEDER
jgi:hypothetical protein